MNLTHRLEGKIGQNRVLTPRFREGQVVNKEKIPVAINLVVIDGVVKDAALRYDQQSKPELRCTLVQTTVGPEGQLWQSYWPCCAVATAAERLASEIEDGQHVVITSGKLAYRKRTVKGVEQSRIEVLVWQVDRLTTPLPHAHEPEAESPHEGGEVASRSEAPGPVETKQGKRRYPKALQQPWTPEPAN